MQGQDIGQRLSHRCEERGECRVPCRHRDDGEADDLCQRSPPPPDHRVIMKSPAGVVRTTLVSFSTAFLLMLLLMNTHLIRQTACQRTIHATNHSHSYFEDLLNDKFSHFIIDEHNGRVFVGAVNKIYQLKPNLDLEAVVEMGPRDDSPECPVTGSCPSVSKRPTDYWNKALVIDYAQSRLISCGSLFQGVCSVHKLANVSLYETVRNESVVSNNATASTFAFIAAGPPKLFRTQVLYVGVTFTGNGPYRSDVPAVSSRSLDSSSMFGVAASGVTTGTRLLLNSLARETYPINYVFGFSAKGFSYFLTVQKKGTQNPWPFVSKLVRICQRDITYNSYTEVPLVCRSSDGTDYNLAQSATVARPGSELAASMGITTVDDVLFVTFAKSQDDQDVYNKPSKRSAVCAYAITAIHRKFTQNIQHCFNGNGNQGLDFVTVSLPCVLTVSCPLFCAGV